MALSLLSPARCEDWFVRERMSRHGCTSEGIVDPASEDSRLLACLAMYFGGRPPLFRVFSWLEADTVNSTGCPGCTISVMSLVPWEPCVLACPAGAGCSPGGTESLCSACVGKA